ncbi:dienelactone hydrolase [Colletotrichum asianum]|uniref:Dienelactone hydrolase n=1 Tax=Colletotrichum asianum TaxID=702518 RepID=A0A8H3W8H4_9PEZI|nr:dienelactone hydrolase [Colletotrichum asianum]
MATSRQVTYDSRGLKIFANLFFPPVSAPDRKNAAIVVGHQGTGVKEQASGLYAKTLASEGFITLAFDAAYQGESEGLPRGLEDPAQRVEDIKFAVTYLSTLGNDVVNPSRIGCVGVCASAGYGISAAATDQRIQAVAGVSTMCFGTSTREGMKDPATGQIDAVKLSQGLEQAAKARIDEMEGKASVTHNILDVFSHPREDIRAYYNDLRWSNPRCTNEMVTRSMELLVTFDSFQYVEWISPRPLLLVAGNEAMTFPYSQQTLQRAKEPKELFVIGRAGHVELYQDVSKSGPKLVDFFARALCM